MKQVLTTNTAAVPAITREYDTLSTMCHPNIVSVFGLFDSPCESKKYLAMERMHGPDLLDFVGQYGVLREKQALAIMRQVLQAVCYMHARGVGHLDIKPDNIMLKYPVDFCHARSQWWRSNCALAENTQVCVVDFGLSVKAEVQQMIEEKVFRARRGTPVYAAPEVSESPYATEKADVWSCGATLFHLLYGDAPYIPADESGGFSAVREKIVAAGPVSDALRSKNASSRRPKRCSRQCQNFLNACLQFDPDRRPTAEQALAIISEASKAAYSSESEVE